MSNTGKKWLFGLIGVLMLSLMLLFYLFAWTKSLISELEELNLVQIKMILVSFLAMIGGLYVVWLTGMLFLFIYITLLVRKAEIKNQTNFKHA